MMIGGGRAFAKYVIVDNKTFMEYLNELKMMMSSSFQVVTILMSKS